MDEGVTAVEQATAIDAARYKANPEERAAHAEKALAQIAVENPTESILAFLDNHHPVSGGAVLSF
jgi:hypothetical protein